MDRSPASFAVRSRPAADAGFSLLEIVVALAILALAMGVVGVSFARSGASLRLEASARTLAADLRTAHSLSLRTGRDVALVVDVDGRAFAIDGRAGEGIPDGVDVRVLSARQTSRGDRFPAIAFSPDGGSTGGVIELIAPGRTMRVEVDWLTGDVRIREGDADADPS